MIMKNKVLKLFLEILCEIIFSIIFLSIGYLLLKLFGVEITENNLDLAVLFGSIAFIIVFLAVCIVINKFKK
ncbi:MAG: hypothetical protein E7358_03005 [Clostridiales bacterium]|nr:hypothetical protein [Clostridiales bacterium]